MYFDISLLFEHLDPLKICHIMVLCSKACFAKSESLSPLRPFTTTPKLPVWSLYSSPIPFNSQAISDILDSILSF